MAKISVRIDDALLDQLRAIAARQGHDLSDVFRDAIRAYLNPSAPSVDPVLKAMADGIRKEAASRGLAPETIVQLWFGMMRPILPKPLAADALKLNMALADEPEEPEPGNKDPKP